MLGFLSAMVCCVEVITWQLIIRSVFTAEVNGILIIPNLNSIVGSSWQVLTVI